MPTTVQNTKNINDTNRYITWSSNSTTLNTEGTVLTKKDLENAIDRYNKSYFQGNECTICGSIGDRYIKYNWGNDKNTERNICRVCHCKAMDKLFGVNRNVDSEIILYSENEE